jgi:hypothetical protein
MTSAKTFNEIDRYIELLWLMTAEDNPFTGADATHDE